MPCEKELPLEVTKGIQLFNCGRFFEAHEALETAWRVETDSTRYLYQGILQLGVGYYHLLNGNTIGAIHLFTSAKKTMETLPPFCQGINVKLIRKQVEEAAMLVEKYKIHPTEHFRLPISQIEIGQVNNAQRE